jgi:O-antigen biosynthesis protein
MNILVVRPKVETAVSYYRGTTVMAHLCREKGWHMQTAYPKEITPDFIAGFDILFDIRPTSEEAIYLIFMAKRAGVKVWIDIDDLLWKIPAANIASRTWSQTAHDNLLRAVLNADVVTVSTDALAEETNKEFGKPCVVIPNAWNDYAGPLPEKWNAPDTEEPFRILYRGSNTHAGDLFAHRDAFQDIPEIEYRFMGEFPWYFFRHYGGHLETIIHEKWQNSILGYFARLDAIRPQAFVFPLEKNRFNECKSNIAWIEATMCGAVCFASGLPEFEKTPCLPFHGLDTFRHFSGSYTTETVEALYQQSRKYLEENLRLSSINEQRESVAKLLTSKYD